MLKAPLLLAKSALNLGALASTAYNMYRTRGSTRTKYTRPRPPVRPQYGLRRKTFGGLRKRGDSSGYMQLTRTSNTFSQTTTAGVSNFVSRITLNLVQTSDLQAMYKSFKISKVVLHLTPRLDPGNSGLTNNSIAMLNACCDPENTTNPTGPTQIGAYANSRAMWVSSGKTFKYTFYPKVSNGVINAAGSLASSGTYGPNPWLKLDGDGIAIPHDCLKVSVFLPALIAASFDYFFDVTFAVRGVN